MHCWSSGTRVTIAVSKSRTWIGLTRDIEQQSDLVTIYIFNSSFSIRLVSFSSHISMIVCSVHIRYLWYIHIQQEISGAWWQQEADRKLWEYSGLIQLSTVRPTRAWLSKNIVTLGWTVFLYSNKIPANKNQIDWF